MTARPTEPAPDDSVVALTDWSGCGDVRLTVDLVGQLRATAAAFPRPVGPLVTVAWYFLWAEATGWAHVKSVDPVVFAGPRPAPTYLDAGFRRLCNTLIGLERLAHVGRPPAPWG